MKKLTCIIVMLLPWMLKASEIPTTAAPVTSSFAKSKINFNRDIRPILADNCFHCHGADASSRKDKLRLDREDGVLEKRKDGPIVERGKPESSLLYKRIIATADEDIMPPPEEKKKLKPEQIQLLKTWIAEGAQWDNHWSFIKPQRPAVPAVRNEKWVRNPIDSFVLAKLEAAGLEPAPEADKRTLARRLSLDLTGLPPEPTVVNEFARDTSPDAYEKLVDKLMAVPSYGEHRARYWLDAARYADTHGLHYDNYREIWPFRDWVINALNANQPFDQFTIEQIAGDLLPSPTKAQIIATGFHRCTVTTNEGGTIAEENICNYARDRVETTAWVWLGLTANCCVCHDHKFDPITMKDFYSMSAFFRNTTQGALDGNVRDTAPIMIMPQNDDAKRWDLLPKEIENAKQVLTSKKTALRAEYEKWLKDAKPSDWEKLDASANKADFHLPINAGNPGKEVTGISSSKPVVFKSAEPLKWEDGGKFGKAPILDGAKAPLIADADIGDFERDKPFTFACWVKMPKGFSGGGSILARMDDTAAFRGWDLYAQDNEFGTHLIHNWDSDAIKVVTKGKRLKPDVWQHALVTYDGSSKAAGFKIYVDGKESRLSVEKNTLKNTTRTSTPLTLGRRKTSSPLSGIALQDLRIYSRKLTPSEIKNLAIQPRMITLLSKSAKDRTAKEKDELFDVYAADNDEVQQLVVKEETLEAEKNAIKQRSPVAHIMEEKKNSMPVAHLLFRGAYDKPKDEVKPATFSALHPYPEKAPKNRLGLAQWLVSPENPLTCRVTVNRFWQELFGTGIVKTSEDFGIMGDPPSHEQLLDWLAVDFRDGGWNMKKVIKSLVMSATYRQAALTTPLKLEKDPANRLLSRGPRFRMDGEMVRDYALAASGLLSSKIGGASVKPYQPDGIWDNVGMPESNTRHYKQDTGDALYRRSLYTFWKRAAPPATMDIFNAPTRETACLRRERTDTPLQALVTLNDPQFVEAARVLAQSAIKNSTDNNARFDFIAQRLLSRPLNEKELTVAQTIQQNLLKNYKEKPADAKALLAVGESKPDAALDATELAAWTMVCNQFMNLDEVLNK